MYWLLECIDCFSLDIFQPCQFMNLTIMSGGLVLMVSAVSDGTEVQLLNMASGSLIHTVGPTGWLQNLCHPSMWHCQGHCSHGDVSHNPEVMTLFCDITK